MNLMEAKRKRYHIISSMIFLINLMIISGILGEHALGYLAGAFECFFLVLLATVYTLPEAMERLIRARMQKGQGKNAMRVLKAAFFLAVIYSLAGSLFLGLGAEFFLCKLLKNSYGAFTLRLFIVPYILFTFAQAFRGFFQGMGSAVPTGVSKILEKIILVGASIFFGSLFLKYGSKVSMLLQNEEFSSSYSSAGVAAGFAVSELFAILFLFFVYNSNKSNIYGNGNKDAFRMTERFDEIIYILVATMLPYILCGILSRISVLGGMAIYQNNLKTSAFDGMGTCGAFYGKYLSIVFGLVMLLRWVAVPFEEQVKTAFRKSEYKNGREKFSFGVHWLMIFGTFFTVLILVLGDTLVKAIFVNDSGLTGIMFRYGSTLILFMALALYFIEILIGQGKIKNVLLNLLIGLLIFFLYSLFSVKAGKTGMEGIIVGHCISWFSLTCCCGFLCARCLKWVPEWIYAAALPVGSSALCGIIMMLLNKALITLVGGFFSFLICSIVGLVGHFTLLFVLNGIRKEELQVFPAGKILSKIAERIHLL